MVPEPDNYASAPEDTRFLQLIIPDPERRAFTDCVFPFRAIVPEPDNSLELNPLANVRAMEPDPERRLFKVLDAREKSLLIDPEPLRLTAAMYSTGIRTLTI